MRWNKIGQIYNPDNYLDVFSGGYGANPVALHLKENIYRIFYNVRDEKKRSLITYLDYDIVLNNINYVCDKPIIEPGIPGTFDDSGCSLGCLLEQGDKIYIYYLGWNLLKTVPWMNTIGVVIFDNVTNECIKYVDNPIISRCGVDPYSLSYPYVMKMENVYQMWYGSHLTWGDFSEKNYDFTHVIKYANSIDGIHWNREGEICIAGTDKVEYAFSRPSVVFENGIYKMWYTFRGEKYRIGYAESLDGLNWKRLDEKVGISISETGWDDEEIAYPMIFEHNKEKYMLYCGNGYGKTGFGLARLVEGEN